MTKVSNKLIFPNKKSPSLPRRLGLPGTHKENKFRIFHKLEGREPFKLLKGSTMDLMYELP